ncbi:hypothetical protein DFJ43DRAFT_1149275 [Lentinula guzmanii]|uniref:Uncharacterized protein n=1 Tax=Lentinula guzmanii TaxID=2804957 RepID=A0AA38JK75_9AGAR|nr:hypothetical protein DFJ43DRAFT_1149275 [Lentinula guzmanii]
MQQDFTSRYTARKDFSSPSSVPVKYKYGIPPAPNGSDAGDRPLCREDFVLPDHVKVALDKGTMFVFAEASDLKEVPLADSIKESGVIPPGYSIDFIISPERIISVLNQVGIKTIGQLPEETYHEMRATINNPSNLSIIPTSVYEIKCQLQAQTDRLVLVSGKKS